MDDAQAAGKDTLYQMGIAYSFNQQIQQDNKKIFTVLIIQMDSARSAQMAFI